MKNFHSTGNNYILLAEKQFDQSVMHFTRIYFEKATIEKQ
jgi:hypothetical protein